MTQQAPPQPASPGFGPLHGTVLEIGPGRRPHLPAGREDRWIGVEPDAAAADHLEVLNQARHGRLTVLRDRAEHLPLPDLSVDVVISSLVLCSVDQPARVLREVRRVLRPGGRFLFVEHVAARRGSPLRPVMRALGPVNRLLNGCHLARDTGDTVLAAGFAHVDLEPYPVPGPFGVQVPHLRGYAYR